MNEDLLKSLMKTGLIEMETEDSMLTIRYRKFFGTEKEFHFELNCKAVYGCKTKKTALKKIKEFINKGFTLCWIG